LGDEGMVAFCLTCAQPRFEAFNTCVLVAVVSGDRVLLLRQDRVSTTHWVLLAGLVKKGETAEETVVREVREETGLRVEDHVYVSSYYHHDKELLLLGFVARVDGTDFSRSREVDAAQWLPLREAGGLLREGSIGKQHLQAVGRCRARSERW
jgi:NAD+ diphosphatase